jgi:hypothetical protein
MKEATLPKDFKAPSFPRSFVMDDAMVIAWDNFQQAIDQLEAFESLEQALLSYSQNAQDTALSQGLTSEEAMNAKDYVYSLAQANGFYPSDTDTSDLGELVQAPSQEAPQAPKKRNLVLFQRHEDKRLSTRFNEWEVAESHPGTPCKLETLVRAYWANDFVNPPIYRHVLGGYTELRKVSSLPSSELWEVSYIHRKSKKVLGVVQFFIVEAPSLPPNELQAPNGWNEVEA